MVVDVTYEVIDHRGGDDDDYQRNQSFQVKDTRHKTTTQCYNRTGRSKLTMIKACTNVDSHNSLSSLLPRSSL